jgi:hypothetical protein
VAEQKEQPEDEEEYKEMIMLRASDFVAFQDILEDIQSQISEKCMPGQARDPGHAPSHLR